jgi:organic radical activating enzyme
MSELEASIILGDERMDLGQASAIVRGAPPVEPNMLKSKFTDPHVTVKGEPRAFAPFKALTTLWFNTGTLCNLACHNCYIESSPRNDRLVYLTRDEARVFLEEAARFAHAPIEIGFTGGEPFMNPDIIGMLVDSLAAGHRVLVLTNAMKPMQRLKPALLDLNARFPGKLTLRVSLDHYESAGHEKIRGPNSWRPAIDGLRWLAANGFDLAVAARLAWDETEAETRGEFRALFETLGLRLDANDPERLVLFPEMDAREDVREISEGCWSILGRSPDEMMCANSRMVMKRKGAQAPSVVSCTLLPYAQAFEMGSTLEESMRPISLNHAYCARFCVLGGASCSSHKRSDDDE